MTFFANSGVAWPDFEKDTRDAGAGALRAASRLLQAFADLESGKTVSISEDDVEFCAEALNGAAKTYSRIAYQLRDATVSRPLLTDCELVDWFGPFYPHQPWPPEWFIGPSPLRIGEL